jgi:predicted nuclease of predicted toxin-antitoxin system
VRFLADENLSRQTVELLSDLGFDVKDVGEACLRGSEDDEVVRFAERENRMIITLDLGYGSIYYFSKKGRVGMIVLRVHPPTVEEVNRVLKDFLSKVDLEKEKLTKCLIMLDKKKYRIRR